VPTLLAPDLVCQHCVGSRSTRRRAVDPSALERVSHALRRDVPSESPPAERRNGHPLRLVYQGALSTKRGHYDLREVLRAIVGGACLSLPTPSNTEAAGAGEIQAAEPGALLRDLDANPVDPYVFSALSPGRAAGCAALLL
jgi:hypothetical protein